jgi:hypothetical protein
MKLPQDAPETLDTLIDAVIQGKPPAPGEAGIVEPGMARMVHDLRALAVATPVRGEFLEELEARLLKAAPANGATLPGHSRRPERRLANVRSLPVFNTRAGRWAAGLCVFVALGAALWTSPAVRAEMHRLACFVPGLGIRTCEAPGYIAARPVSVSRDGATLTVKNVFSSDAETIVQVEITGLRSAMDGNVLGDMQLTLRDANGRDYTAGRQSQSIGGKTTPGAPQTFTAEASFAPLARGVQAVEVRVEGPAPIGAWDAQVSLVPVQGAGLPAAREGASTVTLHGITLRIASVLADHERTAIHLTAEATPPLRFVRELGPSGQSRRLVLRDHQGREYGESASTRPTWPNRNGVYTDDLLFPPLAPDASQAELVVPVVTVEQSGETSVRVPLGAKRAGEHIPFNTELTLNGYTLRITDVEIKDERGERRLVLHLDNGDWRDGKKLAGPGQVLLNGRDRGYSVQWDDHTGGRFTLLSVPLPDDVGAEAMVIFRNPEVAVAGPWRLEVPAQEKR